MKQPVCFPIASLPLAKVGSTGLTAIERPLAEPTRFDKSQES